MAVPPKHDRTAPRGWFSLFKAYRGSIAVVAAVVCVGATLFSVINYQSAARFDRDGVVTDAEVIDREIDRGGDDTSYYITVRFVVDNAVIEDQRSVSQSLYRDTRVGGLHEVRYLPSDPRKFETFVGQRKQQAVLLQVIAGGVGVVSLLALWFFGGRANRAILARRLGRQEIATITSIVETKNSGAPTGRGYLIWKGPDGLRGESLMHPIGKLRAIGVDAKINIYTRKGFSVWEGDVGPRHFDDSRLPKVDRH